MNRHLAHIKQLRTWRVTEAPKLALDSQVDGLLSQIQIQSPSEELVTLALQELLRGAQIEPPASLALYRGSLNLIMPDSSSRYKIQVWLRSGGEVSLKQKLPFGIRKIRVTTLG